MGKATKRQELASSVNPGEMALSAIKKLTRNTGWTARTIIKFIKLEYRINDNKISRKVSRALVASTTAVNNISRYGETPTTVWRNKLLELALKRGVTLGLLQMERGRYRLNEMSRLVKPRTAREIRSRNRPKVQRELPFFVRSRTSSTKTNKNKSKKRT